MTLEPKILKTTPLTSSSSKWISLSQITYSDQLGHTRTWEYAQRLTRATKAGIDGVAVLTLLVSKTGKFKPSTVLIEQFRPPVGKFVVELPAGLVDKDEEPQETAIRELHEETGFGVEVDGFGKAVVEKVSEVMVTDPGMTSANMRLVTVRVELDGDLVIPKPKLEEGEFIVTRVIELDALEGVLKDYDERGFVIDARLSHWSAGYSMAKQLAI